MVTPGKVLMGKEELKKWTQGDYERLVDQKLGQTLNKLKKFNAKKKFKVSAVMVSRLQCDMLVS